jgi:hypothetical protein
MPRSLKLNTVLVSGLAVLFYWSFMFAKHNPALRDVIPFGNDPYDAVGSFGVIVGLMLALLSLIRAFRPYRERHPSIAQRVYLVRTQEAVILVVLITLAADIVAMSRHPQWYSAPSRNLLLVLLGTLALVTVGVHLLVRSAQRIHPMIGSRRRLQAAIAALIALFILLAYPEELINGTATHVFTVIIGDLLLFAPMHPLLAVLVPDDDRDIQSEAGPANRVLGTWYRWSIVLALGALLGCSLFLGEMSEGGGAVPLRQTVFVASIFLGLAIAGLLIAYAFLGAPLGLARSRAKPISVD